MFESELRVIKPGQVLHYVLLEEGRQLSFEETLILWREKMEFRDFFSNILRNAEFDAFRWETPALTSANCSQPFQFVLLNTPSFAHRSTDKETFRPFYDTDDKSSGIVVFENLGKDATLIVPSPRTNQDAYGHLAAFVRNAPEDQVDELWRVSGETVWRLMNAKPVWLSTAGGGVAWLHVRVDNRPKYYGYAPFRSE